MQCTIVRLLDVASPHDGICLVVAFSVLGFVMGYLYTRLFLAGAFVRVSTNSSAC
jgi:hypothetical protein